jgi:prepilin-type N-terminal cleavage/methylation domain-containing protein
MKNRKGFTLAEMMIVIAVIVILSGATAIGVVSWLNNAKNTAANLEANNGDNFEKEEMESIKKIGGVGASMQQPTETLQGTNQQTQQTQGTQSTQQQGQGETQGTRETKETQGTTQTQQTQAQETQQQSSGGETTVGNVTTTIVGPDDKKSGVTSLSGTGNTQTFTLQKLQDGGNVWRADATFTITKNSDGTYTLKVPSSDARYMLNQNVFEGLWKSPIPDYKLTPSQISNLRDEFGINLK